jgi:hypothetical protein
MVATLVIGLSVYADCLERLRDNERVDPRDPRDMERIDADSACTQ